MHVLCFCKSVAAKTSSLLPIVPQETSEVQSLTLIAPQALPVWEKHGWQKAHVNSELKLNTTLQGFQTDKV